MIMIRNFTLIFIFLPIIALQANSSYINTEDHPDGLITISDYVADQPISNQQRRILKKEEKQYTTFEKKISRLYAHQTSGHHGINNIHDPS
jgi:hypothetical protein